MGSLQLALAAAIAFVLPLLDLPTLLPLKRYTSSVARLNAYRKMLTILWSFTVAALLIAPLREIFVLRAKASCLAQKGRISPPLALHALFSWAR